LSITTAPRAFDVLVAGENSVDLVAVLEDFPRPNAKQPLVGFAELCGGEAASAAVGLARLGWRVKYVGRFGDDSFGVMGRESLITEGVNVDDVGISTNVGSRIAVILVERRTGERSVLWRRDPALALTPHDIRDAAIADSRVLLVGSDDVTAIASAAQRARDLDTRTVGDLERVHTGTGELLRQLDVIIMATSFPAAFTGTREPGAALREIAAFSGAVLVCVTLGAEGCLAVVDGREVRVPGFTIEAADTTGAGDLFRAGFVARWLIQPDRPAVVDLLRYANAAAALNCRGVGARTSAPRPGEIEALLHDFNL
jgi:sugar/nucleoside kinase (ribokinase family)